MRAEILNAIRANARERFAALWRENIKRRPKRKPSVWASEVRKMPIGGPVSGQRVVRYDHSYMPHCVEQMDAADDPSVRMIVIWEGIREGKTNGVGLNIIGRTVTDDPGGIYCIQPTKADVEKFNADDLEPMIELSLEDYFVAKKSRDSGRTIDFKKFRGGSIRIPSAGSITAFRGSTVKVLLISEADALVVESIYKALGRTTGLADAIIVMESTGTYEAETTANGKKVYHSVIHEHYEKGDMRKWFVRCASCKAWQVIYYGSLRYQGKDMTQTRWHCSVCDHALAEPVWRQSAAEGKWFHSAGLTDADLIDIEANAHKAKPKQPEVRSYWRNGFTSLLPKSKGYASKLHQFVAEGEAAKGSVEALKTWTNEIAAELWAVSEQGEAPPPWRPIFDRREKYGLTVPEGGLFLTAFCDVHKDRLEVGWCAWGRREEMWGMDHTVIPGYVGDHDGSMSPWRLLRREFARRFKHALQCETQLGFAFIDGGKYADEVYKFLRGLSQNPEPGVTNKVWASKGIGQHGHPIVDPMLRTVAKVLKGNHIGTWEAKDRIYERLRMTPEQGDIREGIMHFNEQFSEEHIQQFVREKVTVVWEKGQEVRKYVNPGSQRNEGLDLLVGNLAAVRIRPRPWDLLEADLRARANAGKPEVRPAQQQPRNASRNSSVAVPGW